MRAYIWPNTEPSKEQETTKIDNMKKIDPEKQKELQEQWIDPIETLGIQRD